MRYLFISSIVPDKAEYHNSAFTRSGQNVMKGIADALYESCDVEFISCKPIPSFPNGPLWVRGGEEKTEVGQTIQFLPTLNILFVKNIVWGFYALLYIFKWARKYRNTSRSIIVYNIYIPIMSLLYRASRLTNSKLYAILYDLGVPPSHLNLGAFKMFGYKQFEKIAYKYIPKIDGRIVINERMSKEYAPGKDYILIDGGINDELQKRLFPLKPSEDSIVTYVLAGMLWEQNGTQMVLDALKIRPDLNVKVIFAGNGNDVPKILEAANSDKRIEYTGMLSMDELFKVYEKADVLLNLRLEEENDMHFPSKLLEYMSIGKWVVSTPIAHAERDYGDFLDLLYIQTPEGLASKMDEISKLSKIDMYNSGVKMRRFMLENRTWRIRTKEILNYIKVNS